MELLDFGPAVPFPTANKDVTLFGSSPVHGGKKAQLKQLSSSIIKVANVLFETIDSEKSSTDHFIILKRSHLNQQGFFK